jgi:D-aminopeptidase
LATVRPIDAGEGLKAAGATAVMVADSHGV